MRGQKVTRHQRPKSIARSPLLNFFGRADFFADLARLNIAFSVCFSLSFLSTIRALMHSKRRRNDLITR